MTRWIAAVATYAEPKVLAILFLGFSSGVPLALTGQTLQVWMRESGVSLAAIGAFALVGLPYVFKFVWAPAIDAVAVPVLSRLLGRRRGWLVASQIALALAIVGLGLNDPVANPAITALLAVTVAFCSATQDIVIDAFRIESLPADRNAAAMANYVAGYRVALLVSTAGAFEVVTLAQAAGIAGHAAWSATYAAMAALVGVGLVVALLSREPDGQQVASPALPLGLRLRSSTIDPFRDFAKREAWVAILLFVMLFKFGDAFAGIMTAPFVLDLGFDRTDYGRVVKIFGFAATLIGGFAGGMLYRGLGPWRALWLAGLLQLLSNLMFVWLALAGKSYPLLVGTIAVENFTGGLGTVIFVAYLSGLCSNRAYTATQYALLSALAAVGRTILSSFAGVAAETAGWPAFFLLTVLAAVPGLLLLAWLGRVTDRTPSAPAT